MARPTVAQPTVLSCSLQLPVELEAWKYRGLADGDENDGQRDRPTRKPTAEGGGAT